MYFIVSDDVTNLLNKVGYKPDWSEEELMNAINPIMKKSASYHAGFLFNPKYMDDKVDDDLPDFIPEALKPTGFGAGIWFENTPFIPGGPDMAFSPKQDLYATIAEDPITQLKNSGLIFSGTEHSLFYPGYMTGAMYQGRVVANSILGLKGLPLIPTTYLNSPFPVSGGGYSTLQTCMQPPFDFNLKLYNDWDRLDKIASKYKDETPDSTKILVLCMTEMVAEIGLIAAENYQEINGGLGWAFLPYAMFAMILTGEIKALSGDEQSSSSSESKTAFASVFSSSKDLIKFAKKK